MPKEEKENRKFNISRFFSSLNLKEVFRLELYKLSYSSKHKYAKFKITVLCTSRFHIKNKKPKKIFKGKIWFNF